MSNVLLSVDGVSRHFGGLWAVRNVTIDIGRGDTLSVIGPNGAGKTTLFNLLSGQLAPSEGKVLFDGRDITRLAPHSRARTGLGRTFQIARPLSGLSVFDNVLIGAMMRSRRRRLSTDRAWQALRKTGLEELASNQAKSLTLAQTKRLEVARALATGPEVLLLDEVMAGLNSVEVDQAIELFQQLNRAGLTIVLIEHNLKVVRAFADRVVVLDHGQLIARGTAAQVLDDPAVTEAYLGKKHTRKRLANTTDGGQG